MIRRREFVASGLAVSFLSRAAAAGLAGPAPTAKTRTVPPFVADQRFLEARVAARAAEARGAAIRWLAEDVTAVYEWLDLAMRAAPFAISGMTSGNALFLIERLAWEHGLRTVYRGLHARARDGRHAHDLLGASALVRLIDDRAASNWAAVLGRELAAWAPDPVHRAQVVRSQAIPCADGATLASWLLVPKGELGRHA
jgi:hypothetical protein